MVLTIRWFYGCITFMIINTLIVFFFVGLWMLDWILIGEFDELILFFLDPMMMRRKIDVFRLMRLNGEIVPNGGLDGIGLNESIP